MSSPPIQEKKKSKSKTSKVSSKTVDSITHLIHNMTRDLKRLKGNFDRLRLTIKNSKEKRTLKNILKKEKKLYNNLI
jgi:hypothetical protein